MKKMYIFADDRSKHPDYYYQIDNIWHRDIYLHTAGYLYGATTRRFAQLNINNPFDVLKECNELSPEHRYSELQKKKNKKIIDKFKTGR